MKIELLVKKGGLNLIIKETQMSLFFKDSSFRMNKFADEKLCIEARTNDFGLKMQADQHYEVIEKNGRKRSILGDDVPFIQSR